MLYWYNIHSISAGFLLRGWTQLLSSSEDWSISDWEALTEKSVRYLLSFSPHDLPKGLFLEIGFSNILPSLKMAFFIVFNLVSKFASWPVAATDIAGAGFILTIPDAECWRNGCCSDSWGKGKSGKNIAVSCGYRNCCLIIHRRKSEWHYEFNKLEDQNIKVYLSLLKIALIVGYIFVASLKCSSQLESSKKKVWESSEFPIYLRGLETN